MFLTGFIFNFTPKKLILFESEFKESEFKESEFKEYKYLDTQRLTE
jgi:hypothetical protein